MMDWLPLLLAALGVIQALTLFILAGLRHSQYELRMLAIDVIQRVSHIEGKLDARAHNGDNSSAAISRHNRGT